jgi:hypothetical protein
MEVWVLGFSHGPSSGRDQLVARHAVDSSRRQRLRARHAIAGEVHHRAPRAAYATGLIRHAVIRQAAVRCRVRDSTRLALAKSRVPGAPRCCRPGRRSQRSWRSRRDQGPAPDLRRQRDVLDLAERGVLPGLVRTGRTFAEDGRGVPPLPGRGSAAQAVDAPRHAPGDSQPSDV